MKIAILTTETLHHALFVREIAARHDDVRVICETNGARAPFDNSHPFEHDRDAFERSRWFDGQEAKLGDFASVAEVETLSSTDGLHVLNRMSPDIAIVFGTGKLSAAVVDQGPKCFLNLHGGDPEEYRGLDTHLWAIYHGDFSGLITTLHRVNATLDDGNICFQEGLSLRSGMPLHELRMINTEACVRLAVAALASFGAQGDVPGRKQRRKGRYYSFMPSVLKDLCVKKFAKYASQLASSADRGQ
jgi:methionyl-tRNA formyltransferase